MRATIDAVNGRAIWNKDFFDGPTADDIHSEDTVSRQFWWASIFQPS